MIHKIISLVLTVVLSLSCLTPAFAEKPTEITRDDKFNEMIGDGLSPEDANYYLDLDEKLKNVKDKISIGDDVSDISNDEVKDKVKFRDKALKLDKAALKKGLNAKVLKLGEDDINTLIQKDPGKNKYRVEYDDGSWAEAVFSVVKTDTPNVTGAVTNGYSSKVVSSGSYSDGTYTLSYTLKEATATSYAKNWVQTSVKVTGVNAGIPNSTVTVSMSNLFGGQSSYGTIQISNNSRYYVRQTANAKWNIGGDGLFATTDPAEAANECVFTVSGSLGLTGAISLNVNGSWTQYAKVKVTGDARWQKVAAIYL